MSSLGDDPRLAHPGREQSATGEEEIVVASSARGLSPYFIVGAFVALAILLFLYLNSRRAAQTDSLVTPTATDVAFAAAPPPLNLTPVTPADAPAALPTPPSPVPTIPPPPPPPDDTVQRLHAPSVVVDLQQSGHAAALPVAAIAAAGGTAPPGSAAKPEAQLADASASTPAAVTVAAGGASPLLSGASGGNTGGLIGQFALGSDAAPPTSVARQMDNLQTTITQGATVPAVLETAINSDLPGYTRAIVSRDVRGFDGKAILIPRGSRVIGQYRSALSLGQSRVFVIWSRIIRPDGVTVQIGSPGGDALGRGGLDGDVDSHFFSRFGGAILLSVLNAGVAAIAGTPSTQISIGSPAAAAGAAASATVPTSSDIPPTITVPQGASVNIFVARDLDFSNVKPVK